MRRARAQFRLLGPAVAALFALATSVPRAVFVYHHHDGAERVHTHAEGDRTLTALLEDAWDGHAHHGTHQHGHRHHYVEPPSGTPSSYPTLENDGAAAGHWHQQQRFQRAVAMVAPQIETVAFAGDVPAAAPARGCHASAPTRQARAPPHASVS